MSHDTNTVDSRTHEGQLNKLGFWIFLTAEFSLFGTLFATLLTLQTWWRLRRALVQLWQIPFQFITCVKKTKLNDVLDDSYCPFRSSVRWIRNLRICSLCF